MDTYTHTFTDPSNGRRTTRTVPCRETPTPGLLATQATFLGDVPGQWWTLTHTPTRQLLEVYFTSAENACAFAADAGDLADWSSERGELRFGVDFNSEYKRLLAEHGGRFGHQLLQPPHTHP